MILDSTGVCRGVCVCSNLSNADTAWLMTMFLPEVRLSYTARGMSWSSAMWNSTFKLMVLLLCTWMFTSTSLRV